jgi:hypothetical protein
LLESETNGSMLVGAAEAGAVPLMVRAVGCSVLVAVGDRSPVLMPVAGLQPRRAGGPRALAKSCDHALRTVNRLPADFVLTLSFDMAANASRFLDRLT